MSGETLMTVIGNLTADPELRFTASGAAVANFTVASTPRTFNKNTQEWEDGEALFLRCSAWRELAENISESLPRGARVVVSGRLKQRSFETKEGDKRTVIELDVDELGASLRYSTAKLTRRAPAANTSGGWPQAAASSAPRDRSDDPWGAAPAARSKADFTDEPPF